MNKIILFLALISLNELQGQFISKSQIKDNKIEIEIEENIFELFLENEWKLTHTGYTKSQNGKTDKIRVKDIEKVSFQSYRKLVNPNRLRVRGKLKRQKEFEFEKEFIHYPEVNIIVLLPNVEELRPSYSFDA